MPRTLQTVRDPDAPPEDPRALPAPRGVYRVSTVEEAVRVAVRLSRERHEELDRERAGSEGEAEDTTP